MANETPDDDSQDFSARTEFDGASGFIQTGGERDDFDPSDQDGILRKFGYDPAQIAIVGSPRISKWEQRSRNRETNEWETVWLTAYKFAIANKGFDVDLPALYNEVRKTKYKPVDHDGAEATIVVCWADIQTGKVDHLGGLEEMLHRLEQKRTNLTAYLKTQKFDHIVVADVGDIIEGFSNFPAQHRTNCLSLMDQVDVAATEFWKTIRLCAQYAPVDVLSIPSNHCAWRREGKNAGKPTDDWGLHINKRLERLNEETQLPVTFYRPPDWMETLQFDIRGTVLGLAHGHQVNSPAQIPNWWSKMSHHGILNADVLVTGHFHFFKVEPSGRTASGRSKWHIQAPTLDNGSAWVLNKQGEDGDPGLCVFRIDQDGFDLTGIKVL
jgi:hypothetical protein